MLADSKKFLFDLKLTSNSGCIQKTYRTFSHSDPLGRNSGKHLEQGSVNHSDTG